ncbi:TIGR04255 family protein [Streptomyces somaliensis]|uniref:TIGR04255 family protein n=1 Tax=Streptomyces somaliensis TaxID=78355 RepID=UPI0020CBB207|nr:TIGR04255 family protein [Streptomyces somaliensis]MCP9944165.1 TIGR04255 family protein [Streptomyces somaliensis]MCP9962599.1 TIGR04255 family protein [Streptomyces somaliensis]MCP9975428.1 TIGR04255 family protein [Streptomyces somaliensis]
MLVDDVPLPDAPLARVIGQLRFGTLSVLASGDDVAQAFVKELSESYPFIEQGLEQTLLFTPGQPVQQAEVGKVWRLRSADRQSVVALTNGALTLETATYQGRTSFCGELTRLAEVLQAVTRVPAYNRVAVRYTNRLTGAETLGQLTSLVHPEFLGLVGAPLGNGTQLSYTLSQSLLSFPGAAKLLVQFGLLPENGTFEPTLPAVAEPSWVLDLDSYEEFPDPRQALPGDADAVSKAAVACAERAHTLFRWAVTQEFLTHFGGQP